MFQTKGTVLCIVTGAREATDKVILSGWSKKLVECSCKVVGKESVGRK